MTNPVFGQKSVHGVHILYNKPLWTDTIHSQGLIYDDLKMTIYKLPSLRLTTTGYPVWAAICRPWNRRRRFPLHFRTTCGI